MSNMTYNPNVNIPYNNNYNNNINMDFEEYGGNFKGGSNYNNSPQLPQMDPRGDPRIDIRGRGNIENMEYNIGNIKNMRPMRQHFDSYYDENDYHDVMPKMNKKSKYSNYDIDTFETTKTDKFDWVLFAKKIVIYTALFLIMSHVKMDELVCRFIPFLNENQILCMTVKGLILALLIILVQMIL